MPTVADSGLEIYPLSLERYERMVDAGILGPNDRVELLRGVLAAVTPQGITHAGVIEELTHLLVSDLPRDMRVRVQLPLRLPESGSEPEPDLAVVEAGPRTTHHPQSAQLVIEVADCSQSRDLNVKAAIYAESGIQEYWVIAVRDRAVTVHREPSPAGYAERTVVHSGALQATDPRIPSVDLDDLLPHLGDG